MYRPYSNSPLNNLPKGSMAALRFALSVGVPESAMVRHMTRGIDGERLEVTKVIWQCRLCRYVTPDQQRAAMAFWDRHKVRYRKPQKAEAAP